jgi:hypothetical protein
VSGFLNPIRAEDCPDGYCRILLEDVVYHVGSLNSTDKIVIPKGFKWDGGSVPRIFWNRRYRERIFKSNQSRRLS